MIETILKNMNKKMTFIPIIIIFIAISGIYLGRYRIAHNYQFACELSGGSWGKLGLVGKSDCVFMFPDAGKNCTSSDQCTSKQCLVLNFEANGPGTCRQDTNYFGCYATIEEIKAGRSGVCVD